MYVKSTHATGDIITAAKGNNWETIMEEAAGAGWVSVSTETWTYASTISFTISGDYSTKYQKGQKIRLVQTSTKYFYNVGTSYSTATGNTTITLPSGTDVLSTAAITAPAFSAIDNPMNFPHWFNFEPTVTGFSANPTNTVYRFNISSGTVNVSIRQAVAGTSNANTFTISAPVVAKTITNMAWVNTISAEDNSASVGDAAIVMLSAGSIFTLNNNGQSTGWTASGSKRANGELFYEF